jgi:hypothetical protein
MAILVNLPMLKICMVIKITRISKIHHGNKNYAINCVSTVYALCA